MLGRLRHANLVRLLGAGRGAVGSGQMALVYELMKGGSLYHRLFGGVRGPHEEEGKRPPLGAMKRWVSQVYR